MVTYWGLDARDPRIDAVARRIGADVPFFLYGPPAYCDGARRYRTRDVPPAHGHAGRARAPPGPRGLHGRAYRRFDESPVALPPLEPLLEALRKHDETEIFANVANNLAPASCELHPAMAEALAWIGDQRDVRASAVAGSGSTVFAICNTQMAAEAIVLAARARGWWGEVAQMEKSGPYISVG